MAGAATDYFCEVGNPGTATALAAPGHTIAGTTFNVTSTANWPTTTGGIYAVDTYDISTGLRVPGSYTEWEGVVASATQITGGVLRYGTDQNYSAGSTTRVYIPVASSRENRLAQGILVEHNQTGTHSNITATSITATTGTFTNLTISGAGASGFNALGQVPNTVTYNGNRSYTCVFNAVDLTATLSAGMRLRTTRTVAAPTQCTSLNGTTQYYSKTSPAGMTFTDNYTLMGWIKPTSYAAGGIISRYSSGADDGFILQLNASGQVLVYGAGTNQRSGTSYQSVPLNKWTHVAATLTLSTGVTTIYIDGVLVPSVVAGTGTSITQAGNLEVGSTGGGANFFPGKIAQAAVFSAVLSQATIQSYISQGLIGTETSLISAYSFNNTITDLNTTNANNLTANGSAVATNADSPFGGQASGLISSTLDYGIVQSCVFSTNTTVVVQVPEGCTIPTSGGVSAVSYSSNAVPYGFPKQRGKWEILSVYLAAGTSVSIGALSQWFNLLSQATVPIGEWILGYEMTVQTSGTNATIEGTVLLAPATPTNANRSSELSAGFFFNNTVNSLYNIYTRKSSVSVSTATPYIFYGEIIANSAATTMAVAGSLGLSVIKAENAYL